MGKKLTKIVMMMQLLLLSLGLFSQDAIISQIRGKVEIREAGGRWFQAREEQVIPAGSEISTGINSSARLQINQSVVTIQPLTRMSLDEITSQGNQETTRLNLNTGRVSAQVRSTGDTQVNFEVRSPIATASVRGTDFDFDGSQLQVSEGRVVVVNQRNQTLLVAAGNSTTVTSNTPPKPPVAAMLSQVQAPASTLPPEPAPPAPPAPPAAVVLREVVAATPAPVVVVPETTGLNVEVRVRVGQ